MLLLELRGDPPAFVDIEALETATADYSLKQIHFQYNPSAIFSKTPVHTFSFRSCSELEHIMELLRGIVKNRGEGR